MIHKEFGQDERGGMGDEDGEEDEDSDERVFEGNDAWHEGIRHW